MYQNISLQVGLVMLAYLLGSLPFGYWFGKFAKGGAFDIRNYGSGNIGFTAIGREVSWGIAIPVLIFDALKAWGPVTLAKAEFGVDFGMLCLIFVMLGHAYSLYFWVTEKHPGGGKSVAAALGGIVALHPAIAGWSLVIWAIILLCTRTMSIASMLGSVCAFLLTLRIHIGLGLDVSFGYGLGLTWNIFFGLVSALIVYFHKRNIGRLLHRNEKPLFEWRDICKLWQKRQTVQDNELVVWFMIHPLQWSDLMQSVLIWWIYWMGKWPRSARIGIWILSVLPVIENAEVTGITLKDERQTRVKIKTGAILYLSGMIEVVKLAEEVDAGRMKVGYGEGEVSPELYKKASLLRDRLWKRLQSGTVQGRRIGSHVAGLGALLSTRF
ncbi:MAG: glycerol-3-phosphate acyltransferase, partial [Patescibacteria group bacterium]